MLKLKVSGEQTVKKSNFLSSGTLNAINAMLYVLVFILNILIMQYVFSSFYLL